MAITLFDETYSVLQLRLQGVTILMGGFVLLQSPCHRCGTFVERGYLKSVAANLIRGTVINVAPEEVDLSPSHNRQRSGDSSSAKQMDNRANHNENFDTYRRKDMYELKCLSSYESRQRDVKRAMFYFNAVICFNSFQERMQAERDLDVGTLKSA